MKSASNSTFTTSPGGGSAVPGWHDPDWHASFSVQADPSSQAAPSGFAGLEHDPLPGSQFPATWQPSSGPHTTGLPPWHTPVAQASVCVQALPSLHPVPLGWNPLAGQYASVPVQVSAASHCPAEGLQTAPAPPAVCMHVP
jgi:hypothetical protein